MSKEGQLPMKKMKKEGIPIVPLKIPDCNCTPSVEDVLRVEFVVEPLEAKHLPMMLLFELLVANLVRIRSLIAVEANESVSRLSLD